MERPAQFSQESIGEIQLKVGLRDWSWGLTGNPARDHRERVKSQPISMASHWGSSILDREKSKPAPSI